MTNGLSGGAQAIQRPQPPRIYNSSAWKQLPSATSSGQRIEAVLLEYDIAGNTPKPLWYFLMNPQSLHYSKQAEYDKIATLAAKIPDLQFKNTDSPSLEISDIVLDTFCFGKTVQPLINGIQSLLEANIDKNQYNPPILAFRWGKTDFSPCVLTKCDWNESGWINGEVARAKLSISLLKIPRQTTRGQIAQKKQVQQQQQATANEKNGQLRMPLTERQKEEASAAAKKYLEKNISQWSAETQAIIKTKSYKLLTDKNTGVVALSDAKNKSFGTILVWDGKQAKSGGKITTIPLKQGGKAP